MSNSTKQKSSILQTLESKSKKTYDKVANKMQLAANIENAMQFAHLSRKQFADKMGKRPSEITKWLSGTHNFTIETLLDISKTLDVDLYYLTNTDTIFRLEDNKYVIKSMVTTKYLIQKQKKGKVKNRSFLCNVPYTLTTPYNNNIRYEYC